MQPPNPFVTRTSGDAGSAMEACPEPARSLGTGMLQKRPQHTQVQPLPGQTGRRAQACAALPPVHSAGHIWMAAEALYSRFTRLLCLSLKRNSGPGIRPRPREHPRASLSCP